MRLRIAALGVALLAAGCTHPSTRQAAGHPVHGAAMSHIWPAAQPITYGVIDCGGDPSCTSGFTGSVPAALRRPLHLPAIVQGRCPTLRARVVEAHVGPALGPGPIYPVIGVTARRFGVLTFDYPPLRGSLLAGSGFGGHKVLWIGAPRYRGPVLIRGGELVGHNPVMFSTGTAMLFPELQFPPQSQDRQEDLPSHGWRGWPTGTDIRAPGCYAWQIDGTTFSYTVVYKAVRTS